MASPVRPRMAPRKMTEERISRMRASGTLLPVRTVASTVMVPPLWAVRQPSRPRISREADTSDRAGQLWITLSPGARMAAAGAGAEEITAFIQDWLDHVRVVFCPLDLRFAKKSGRVSAAAAFVGEALGLKPVMTFEDGDSKILAKVRGEKNVLGTLLSMCRKERRTDTPYLLIRAGNEAAADQLLAACREELGGEPAMEYYIGGVIAINAGPNLVGLVYRT